MEKMKLDIQLFADDTDTLEVYGFAKSGCKYPVFTKEQLINLVYPIGTFYETDDVEFDPNEEWVGTWVEDTKGLTFVAHDENDDDFKTIGSTYGSKSIQKHTHTGRTKGGQTPQMRVTYAAGNGMFTNHIPGHGNGMYKDVKGDYPGANHYHTFTTDEAGEGECGNVQPSYIGRRWHRIA